MFGTRTRHSGKTPSGKILSKAAQRAGLPTQNKKVENHSVRKTGIGRLLDAVTQENFVCQLMGHKNLQNLPKFVFWRYNWLVKQRRCFQHKFMCSRVFISQTPKNWTIKLCLEQTADLMFQILIQLFVLVRVLTRSI